MQETVSSTDVTAGIAAKALELQKQINSLATKLDAVKDELRELANGNKLKIVVEGSGVVDVSSPREGSEKIVLTFDEEKLKQIPDLKTKLLEKGVIKEVVSKVSAARASVSIKPNV